MARLLAGGSVSKSLAGTLRLFEASWEHVVLCIVLDLFPFPHLCSVYFVDPLVYLTGFLLIVLISYLLLRPEEVPHQKFAAHLICRELIEANDANLLDEEGNSKFPHHA